MTKVTESTNAQLKLSTPVTTAQNTDSYKRWQTTALPDDFAISQMAISHYSFDASALKKLTSHSDSDFFWFTLGINDNSQLTIDAVAVTTKKEVVGTVHASIIQKTAFEDRKQLAPLQTPHQYTSTLKEHPFAAHHLIDYNAGNQYISRWQTALQSSGLEEVVSYKDQHYIKFGIEATTIAHMIAQENVTDIALYLGVNPSQELTTVFIRKDKENTLLLTSSSKNTADEGVYDVSIPHLSLIHI